MDANKRIRQKKITDGDVKTPRAMVVAQNGVEKQEDPGTEDPEQFGKSISEISVRRIGQEAERGSKNEQPCNPFRIDVRTKRSSIDRCRYKCSKAAWGLTRTTVVEWCADRRGRRGMTFFIRRSTTVVQIG